MRALIIGDVHGNLEAFHSIVEDSVVRGGFDQIWSLGDLVGYGPSPGHCIDFLRDHDHLAVAGNHDLASIGKLSLEAFNPNAAEANRWTSTQLSKDQASYIRGLPLKFEVDEFTAVHGSPRDPIWEYVVTVPSAVASFMHFDSYRCLVGHSHVPFLCRPAENGAVFLKFPEDTEIKLGTNRLIINPGGAGQPRDGDPRACYAVYDSDKDSVVHHRVEYDIHTTQDKMKMEGLPEFLVNRLAEGR